MRHENPIQEDGMEGNKDMGERGNMGHPHLQDGDVPEIRSIDGVSPITACTVVSGSLLLSLCRCDQHDGFEYGIARIGTDESGRMSLVPQVTGIVSDMGAGADGIAIAIVGALPDGFADSAVIMSDRGASDLLGMDIEEFASTIGLSVDELSGLVREAWRIGGEGFSSVIRSRLVGLTDCDGRVVSIGDWIRDGDGEVPHRVVGIAINEFHGPMVMVDDAITGSWIAMTGGMRIVDNPISTWEELIEIAERRLLPKEELVRIAEKIARKGTDGALTDAGSGMVDEPDRGMMTDDGTMPRTMTDDGNELVTATSDRDVATDGACSRNAKEGPSIGRRIRQLRETDGMTEAMMAEYLGMTVQGLRDLEAGRIPLTVCQVEAIADLFCMSFDDVVAGRPQYMGIKPRLMRTTAEPDALNPDAVADINRIIRNMDEMGRMLGRDDGGDVPDGMRLVDGQ